MTDYPRGKSPEKPSDPNLPTWAKRANNNEPMGETRLAAFIGRKWESSYRKKFAAFLADASFVPTWNWSAFLAMPYWFLYRKLYLPFVVFLFAPGIIAQFFLGPEVLAKSTPTLAQPEITDAAVASFAFYLAAMVAAGGTANWLLFRRARAATHFVAQQQLSEQDAQTMLIRLGGVHRGPTILLVVMGLVVVFVQYFGQSA